MTKKKSLKPLKKTKTAADGAYKYVTLDDVMEILKKTLPKYKLGFVQFLEEKDGNNSDTADKSCNSLRKAHSSKLIYFIGFTSAEEKNSFSGIMTNINLKIGGINIFTVLKI